MNILMAGLAGVMLLLGSSASAAAYSINYNELTPGVNSVTNVANGWTATAWSDQPTVATFATKTVNGLTAVGVANGFAGGEIDLNEYIVIDFVSPMHIDSITLGFLYAAPPWGDPDERAGIYASTDSDLLLGTLTAGPVTGTWATVSGTGLLHFWGTNATSKTDQAKWTVYDPFGDTAVSGLIFTPLSMSGGFNNDSDFGLVEITAAPVPEPGTVVLLGTGLLGLVFFCRRLQMK